MAVFISGKNLPEVWEKSIVEVWDKGRDIKTQYDKPDDPPSKDVTIMMEITEPMSEPRIHRAFPGGITELETYRQEVVDGIHDHWVDPAAGKWEYTYHERLTKYNVPIREPHAEGIEWVEYTEKHIDQIKYIIDTLKACPYSRRAQGITWKPWEDAGISDPACLQRMWCRIFDGKLDMNIHFRSNDAFKASFMNMWVFTEWQKVIADALEVPVGVYTHIADSFHIYSSYFEEVKGFLKQLEVRTFEERTYRTDDPIIQEWFEEAKEQIAKSIEEEKRTGRKGL